MPPALSSALAEIQAVGQRLDARGLALATSGNYSVRLGEGRIAITVSGSHKGRLRTDDVTEMDADGRALGDRPASAEAALHASIYRLYPHAQAVLHVHSVASITLTRLLSPGCDVVLHGYETLKAFPGITTHEARVVVPVFDNSQDVPALTRAVEARLVTLRPSPSAFLLRGHGLYAWGSSISEAERVLEALEQLLACELEASRIGHKV